MQDSAFTILSVIAISLLALVTGGIAYLTFAEWRDRRRRDREQREQR